MMPMQYWREVGNKHKAQHIDYAVNMLEVERSGLHEEFSVF